MRDLRREQIEHRADAGAVAAKRHLVGLLRAGHEILAGGHPAGRRLEGVIGAEDLEHHLLAKSTRPGRAASARATASR